MSLFFLISHPVCLIRCDGALTQLSFVRLKNHGTELKISSAHKLAKPGRSTLGPVPSAPTRKMEKEGAKQRNAEGIDLSLNYKIRTRSTNMTERRKGETFGWRKKIWNKNENDEKNMIQSFFYLNITHKDSPRLPQQEHYHQRPAWPGTCKNENWEFSLITQVYVNVNTSQSQINIVLTSGS